MATATSLSIAVAAQASYRRLTKRYSGPRQVSETSVGLGARLPSWPISVPGASHAGSAELQPLGGNVSSRGKQASNLLRLMALAWLAYLTSVYIVLAAFIAAVDEPYPTMNSFYTAWITSNGAVLFNLALSALVAAVALGLHLIFIRQGSPERTDAECTVLVASSFYLSGAALFSAPLLGFCIARLCDFNLMGPPNPAWLSSPAIPLLPALLLFVGLSACVVASARGLRRVRTCFTQLSR